MSGQDPNQGARAALAGQLPDPPPFWQSFTPENLARMKALRQSILPVGLNTTTPGDAGRIPDDKIPADLVYLQPPSEPENGTWRVFGDMYTLDDKLPSLEEQGMDRLVSAPATAASPKEVKHIDRALELKRLAKSILLNFLELTGAMSIDPEAAGNKITDLRTLFINFHHVLNEYRPHQAREQAISMMQDRLDKIRAETTAINAQVDKAKRVLDGLASIEVPSLDDTLKLASGKSSSAMATEARETAGWADLDSLVS